MHLVGLGKIAIKVTLNFQFYPRRPDWFVIIHEDPCIRTLLPMILINKHQTQKHYKAKENNSNSRTLSLIKGFHHYLVAVLLGCMQKEISSRVSVFHTFRKADQSNRRIPDCLKLKQTILRKIFRRNIDACVPFIFFEIEVGRILAVTFPHTQNCCKKEKSRWQMVAYFKFQ